MNHFHSHAWDSAWRSTPGLPASYNSVNMPARL